jgi:hypothetical protein
LTDLVAALDTKAATIFDVAAISESSNVSECIQGVSEDRFSAEAAENTRSRAQKTQIKVLWRKRLIPKDESTKFFLKRLSGNKPIDWRLARASGKSRKASAADV